MFSPRVFATRSLKIFLCLVLATAFANVCLADGDFAGTLKQVHGQVSVHRGTQIIPALTGGHISVQDIIQTEAASSVGIILHDGTRLSLGPNSALTVQEFVFEPGEGKLNLFIRMLSGVMAYTSGKIAQLSPQSVRVETPVGVIGLRGTKFAVSLDPTTSAVK